MAQGYQFSGLLNGTIADRSIKDFDFSALKTPLTFESVEGTIYGAETLGVSTVSSEVNTDFTSLFGRLPQDEGTKIESAVNL